MKNQDFKADIIKMLHQGIINFLKTNEKYRKSQQRN